MSLVKIRTMLERSQIYCWSQVAWIHIRSATPLVKNFWWQWLFFGSCCFFLFVLIFIFFISFLSTIWLCIWVLKRFFLLFGFYRRFNRSWCGRYYGTCTICDNFRSFFFLFLLTILLLDIFFRGSCSFSWCGSRSLSITVTMDSYSLSHSQKGDYCKCNSHLYFFN